MAGRSSGLPVPVLVTIAVAMAASTGGFFFLQNRRSRPAKPPVLTSEAAAYLAHLQLTDVDMELAENYLKQTVTTITGKITNKGPRTLRLVEVNCVFRDLDGRIALRQPVAIVGRKTGPVATGQTRPFELAFDNIPAGWNQALPDLVISQILFQDSAPGS